MDYTRLVGETGAMSSGELFADGGYADKGVYVETLDEEIDLSEEGRVRARKTQQGGNKSFGELREMHGASPEALAFDNGGSITDVTDAIFYPNQKNGKIKTGFGDKTKEGLFAMISSVNYDAKEISDAIFEFNEKSDRIKTGFGSKTKQGLTEMIKNVRNTFAEGGSLGNHGLKQGDQIIKTMSGGVQKVKTKSGDIVYVNLANGYRGDVPPLPFDGGGRLKSALMRDRKNVNYSQDYEVRYSKDKSHRSGYTKPKMSRTQFEEESFEFFDGGGVTKNYINRNQLNTITIKKGDQKLTYKVSDVYNGAYKLEDGGNLEKMAFYIPKRNVVKVQLRDGKDVKVANGYWIKKGAKPIHTSKYDDGGEIRHEDYDDVIDMWDKLSISQRKKILDSQEDLEEYGNHSEIAEDDWDELDDYVTDVLENNFKSKMYAGGGKTTFKEKATAIAKNFEGKKVEPKYQKEYGKTYDKAEAKEVGNKIAGSQKAKYDSKMSGGGKTKRGGAMQLAKQIRKDGESWQSALKRANEQMRNK